MFMEAERFYEAGDVDSALITYLLAAELGVEVAQSNVAYILEQGMYLSYLVYGLYIVHVVDLVSFEWVINVIYKSPVKQELDSLFTSTDKS